MSRKKIKEKNNVLKILYCFFPVFIFYFLDYLSILFIGNTLSNNVTSIYFSSIKTVYIVKGIIIFPALFLISIKLYKNPNAKKAVLFIMISTIIQFILSGIVYLFINSIFSSFNMEQGAINYSIYAAKILLISSSIVCIPTIVATHFLFLKKFKISILLFLTRQILILFPIIILFHDLWRLKGILFAVPAADVLSVVICMLIFIFYNKKYL